MKPRGLKTPMLQPRCKHLIKRSICYTYKGLPEIIRAVSRNINILWLYIAIASSIRNLQSIILILIRICTFVLFHTQTHKVTNTPVTHSQLHAEMHALTRLYINAYS